MTEKEKGALRAIIKAFNVPRDRLGRPNGDLSRVEDMRQYALAYSIPHGGRDTMDQAMMILQAMVGDTPKSIMD